MMDSVHQRIAEVACSDGTESFKATTASLDGENLTLG